MKKFLCGALVAALLIATAVPALADIPSLKSNMCDYAKAALYCLATGDYDRVVTGLPFSGLSPSADEWRGFAEGAFSSLVGSTPQTKYAVAYWTGRVWRVAVPVSTPNTSGVDTLVLTSEDGSSFSGYACASWGSVCNEYQGADYVTWDEEYSNANSAIVNYDE